MNIGFRTALVLIGLAATTLSTVEPVRAQDVERGHELFELCSRCHGAAAEGNQLFLAPSIAGLPLWYLEGQLTKFREGGRGAHFDDIPGMRMRPMALSLRTEHGDDLKDVAAYVASLPPVKPAPTLTGGDAARGATFYAVCQACHGAAGEGVPGTNAPPVAHQSDWYLLSSIQRFRSGARGSSPTDANGAVMRGMVMTLPDEQAIKDVIAYMVNLGSK